MTTRIQQNQHIDWACLPCMGNTSQSYDGNPSHRRRNSSPGKFNEPKQTEDLLASELNKLSVQERTEALDDVHCVAEDLKETPEMIEKSLYEFETAVQRSRSSIYDLAWNQNRAFVEDHTFRLKFLRANMHDANKSVRQMMRFLEQKAMYFGDEKVAREITLDDLDEEDMEVLLSGLWHLQEERDHSGRAILHMFGNLFGKYKVENTIRALYFVYNNIMIREPLVQIYGSVTVYHNVSIRGEKPANPGINFVLKVSDASMSFPIRHSAAHYCLEASEDNLILHNSMLRLMLNSIPRYIKVRIRVHVGSTVEIRYQLPSHGIPLSTFPIDMQGKVRENILNLWLYKYQQIEGDYRKIDDNKSTSNSEVSNTSASSQHGSSMEAGQPSSEVWPVAQDDVAVPSTVAAYTPFVKAKSIGPTKNDILLGRGRFAQSWDGNVMFRLYMEAQSDEYDSLLRAERQRRTIEITNELLSMGIRFFEQKESGDWVEAEFSEARKKVSQMFRSIRKKK